MCDADTMPRRLQSRNCMCILAHYWDPSKREALLYRNIHVQYRTSSRPSAVQRHAWSCCCPSRQARGVCVRPQCGAEQSVEGDGRRWELLQHLASSGQRPSIVAALLPSDLPPDEFFYDDP